MTRIQPPVCPTCLRRHWELMGATPAAYHVHVRYETFQAEVAAGRGPAPCAHGEMYKNPRYHVDTLDAWMRTTARDAA